MVALWCNSLAGWFVRINGQNVMSGSIEEYQKGMAHFMCYYLKLWIIYYLFIIISYIFHFTVFITFRLFKTLIRVCNVCDQMFPSFPLQFPSLSPSLLPPPNRSDFKHSWVYFALPVCELIQDHLLRASFSGATSLKKTASPSPGSRQSPVASQIRVGLAALLPSPCWPFG